MYYVVSIQKQAGSNPCAIFAYETREQAFSVYHQTLASNYAAIADLDGFCVLVLNEHGGTEVREFWEKPEPTPNE